MSVYLITERLTLRQFRADDADNLMTLDSDPDVRRFLDLPNAPSRSEVIERILPGFLAYYERLGAFGYWAAEETASDAFLGWFHLRPSAEDGNEIELGYRLKKSVWDRGYATEGARALVRHGFLTLGVGHVTARALTANTASIRVMEKTGLKFEMRYWYKPDLEAVKYGLDKADYVW